MSRNVDETKQNLGIESLGDKQKKELFNKFIKHGGEVIDDHKPPKHQMFDKEKQKQFLKMKNRDSNTKQTNYYSSMDSPENKQYGPRKRIGIFFEKIKLYISSVFQHVMDSSGTFLSEKFFRFLKSEAQNKLLDLQLLLTPLVHAETELRLKIQASLSIIGYFHYELLLRLDKIYKEREYNEIVSLVNIKKHARITPRSIGEPLVELYKKIYILRKFSRSCQIAVEGALEVQANYEKKDRIALKYNLSGAKKDLNLIFDKLLPKLHLAVLNILKRNFKMGNDELEEFIGITYEDTVGYLTEKMTKELMTVKAKEKEILEQTKEDLIQEKNEIKVDTLPDQIKEGLLIMKEIPSDKESIPDLKETSLAYIDKDDKMFPTEIMFNEFDKEYSFILTSTQLHFSPDYQEGKKIDTREELSDNFIEFNHIRELIAEYNVSIKEQYEVEKAPQYTLIQKSKMLHSLSITITKNSRHIRDRFGNLMTSIETTLKRILIDYNRDNRILENPEDKVDFNTHLIGKKKLDGNSIIDCVVNIYYFVSALRYRLLTADLAGLGCKIERTFLYKEDEEDVTEEEINEEIDESGDILPL